MKIKAIIIDDEPVRNKNIATILKKYEHLEVISVFESPYEGLIDVLDSVPDVLFLDVEMEEMNGIQLTKIVNQKYPDINIVFITESEKYAVQAFEINAVDYLLKPVKEARLLETISRLEWKLLRTKVQYNKVVGSLGGLYFRDENHTLLPNVKWRTKKTEELFAYLLHNHTKEVRTDVIIDLLWPHVDTEQGIALLYSSVYQMRRSLKQINFKMQIENNNNTYCLKLNGITYDIHNWEAAMDQLPELTLDTIYDHLQVIKMYKGNYLERHDYVWAEEKRKVLNDIWWHHIDRVVNFLNDNTRYMEAIRILLYVKDISYDCEKGYFYLMKLYAKVKDNGNVKKQYLLLKNMLLTEFDAVPTTATQTWYKAWLVDRD